MTTRLLLTDARQLGFRRRFGDKIVHTGLCCNSRGREWIISGDHHRLDPHLAQFRKTLADSALHHIL